jgi:hypothetical protein
MPVSHDGYVDKIMATGVGLLGCALRDFEAERVERYDGWRREPFV